MSDLEKRQSDSLSQNSERSLPASAVRATMNGDWNGVSEQDRMRFLKHMCDALSIPLVLNPFKFIQMKGKVVLYSTAEAAFSLARKNKITVKITQESFDKESQIYTVKATATHPKGESSDDVGKLYMGGLAGQDRANAEMKVVTKAKRRAIFSAVGLSVMGDDEIEHLRNLDSYSHTSETLSETPEPKNIVEAQEDLESEDQEWRSRLFDSAVDHGCAYEGDPQAFASFLKERTGKTIMQLTASECEDLIAELNEGEVL